MTETMERRMAATARAFTMACLGAGVASSANSNTMPRNFKRLSATIHRLPELSTYIEDNQAQAEPVPGHPTGQGYVLAGKARCLTAQVSMYM